MGLKQIQNNLVVVLLFLLAGLLMEQASGCNQAVETADGGKTITDGSQPPNADPADGSGSSRDIQQPADLQSVDMTRPNRAVVINFDDHDGQITDQYQPDAVFSTTAGKKNVTLSFGDYFHSSKPNILCGTDSCAKPTYVDFGRPVSNLTFLSVGANNNGKVAEVNVFVRGIMAATVPITGMGTPKTPIPVDLSAYSDITRIEIVNINDDQGIGYDDFHFLTY